MTAAAPTPSSFRSSVSGGWIRLRTLVLLRWWAIAGQVAALEIAQRLYHLNLEAGLCYLVIGAAVISNLVATFIFPENRRLSEIETLFVVLFDMLQLGVMLYLTGGLNNPFSILIVGPVTVSASALGARSTAFLGAAAIVIVTLLIGYHLPLRTVEGVDLRVPEIFRFGNWVAIVIAVVFLGVYSRWVVQEMHAMSDALQATQMALAREQRLTDLGGVVAAAAHELGTPLATIKLTGAELIDELADRPDQKADAQLIVEQADRCRDILRSMGRAGKEDEHLRYAPLSAILEEAAEPHGDRGKSLTFEHVPQPGAGPAQPLVHRRPEIIHGLRNLIQNAVDFARREVRIESRWSENVITLRILDDGPGFPPQVLGRIGEPFMNRRTGEAVTTEDDGNRPEYQGMGLGLFIAKTLLERSGAELGFANGGAGAGRGAVVEVTWPRSRIAAPDGRKRDALGSPPQVTTSVRHQTKDTG